MKSIQFYIVFTISLSVIFCLFVVSAGAQQKEPWTSSQLLDPSVLASIIDDSAREQPVVICVGPGAVIKNSHDAGPAGEKANLKKLKAHLDTLQRDANIVIYCGCCPFSKCPNIRPAFTLLNDMGFKNHQLLNIPQNIKTDWIDRGYPVNE